MATAAANERRSDKTADAAPEADEGVEGLTEHRGPLADVVATLSAGVRSGLSYCGGHTVAAARERAEFVRVAPDARDHEDASVDALDGVPERE
jgi:IMP dehydrogenase